MQTLNRALPTGLASERRFLQTRRISLEDQANLVTDAPELGPNLLGGARRMGRVTETPVVTVQLPRKDRADLIGIAADGDHRGHGLIQKLVLVLRMMRRGIQTDLLQDRQGHRVDIPRRLRARAGDVRPVPEGAP